MKEKKVVGLTEDVVISSETAKKTVHARIDTGAVISSIDIQLAAELRLGPIEKVKTIKSANGKVRRPTVRATFHIQGEEYNCACTLADRSHMKYQVLIGQDILRQGFLVDPNKNTLIKDSGEEDTE